MSPHAVTGIHDAQDDKSVRQRKPGKAVNISYLLVRVAVAIIVVASFCCSTVWKQTNKTYCASWRTREQQTSNSLDFITDFLVMLYEHKGFCLNSKKCATPRQTCRASDPPVLKQAVCAGALQRAMQAAEADASTKRRHLEKAERVITSTALGPEILSLEDMALTNKVLCSFVKLMLTSNAFTQHCILACML